MEKVTVTLTRAEADRINALLDIDDIGQYDGDLSVSEDCCEVIRKATFDDGVTITVCLMSGETNYYTTAFYDLPGGKQDEDIEPDYCLSDVEYEYNGINHVLHFEIA